MNSFAHLLRTLAASLVILSACALPPVHIPEEGPPSPEARRVPDRFEEADRLVEAQSYSRALEIYVDYVTRFPRGPMADFALMKAGSIYMLKADYPKAREAFGALLDRYPKSAHAEEARFNMALAYYNEADYTAAANYAGSALKRTKTAHQKFRLHNLIGDAYCADKKYEDGILSYVKAYELAEPQGRAEVVSNVKEVLPSLEERELISLIDKLDDKVPGDYLRLQLAKNYGAQDRLDLAMEVLGDFMTTFPRHDEMESALSLMEELKSRSLVDRFSIGCVLPLSGPYESFGNRALRGIEIALHQFNSQPNVTQVELIIRDSRGDPDETASAVEALALENGVIGIIGPMITSETAAIRSQELMVPIVTLTQKPDITMLGDYVFRNFMTMSIQVKAAVKYAVKELGIKKFAILYPQEPYGISFMNRFWDELLLYDAEVVGIESYAPEQTDFADSIKKLAGVYYSRRTQKPEEKSASPIDFGAVFIPDDFEKAGMIASQLLYYDVANVVLLGTNLWHSDDLIETANDYVQGAIVPDGFFIYSTSPGVQDFVELFEAAFNTSPGYLEAQAYDTASILCRLVNRPDVVSRRTLQEALLKVKDFPGVTGLTSFDETGDVSKEIYLLKVEGRRFVQIRP